ncbi:MAG: ATP-binding protein [Prevotellaceae bacterium]|jgi:predicted AAA+ superfamily ATPase|nr:ATP-binding protein [Prevotellaceae bacterium]
MDFKQNMVERKPYMQQLRSWRNQHVIKVVTGMRRSGKSTLLEMLADEIRQDVGTGQVHFYSFEDPDVLEIGGYKAVYDHVKVRLAADAMNYVFLDEVQNVEQFERLVDGLFIKRNVDLYITGSNAYLLSSELATLLTGRYVEINILPFSFGEYYSVLANSQSFSKNKLFADLQGENPQNFALDKTFADLDGENPQNFIFSKAFADLSFRNYLYVGGIPQTVEVNNGLNYELIISSIFSAIIEKDIFSRHNVYSKPTFYKIADFILDSVGSYISPNSIANVLKNEKVAIDNETVSRYLKILTDAYLICKAPRYEIKGKGLLATQDKYYLTDVGFRHIRLSKKRDDDLGHLLENVVYLELVRRNKNVFVGKIQDKEVDFVAIGYSGYVSYYQIAFSVQDGQTLERELAPLRAIRDANPKYLLSADWDTDPVYDGIRKLNVINWLLCKY